MASRLVKTVGMESGTKSQIDLSYLYKGQSSIPELLGRANYKTVLGNFGIMLIVCAFNFGLAAQIRKLEEEENERGAPSLN